MGIYYIAPLLGPSIGPIIGGVLTQVFNWTASFWFLVIFGSLNFMAFLFLFKDTYRKERSLVVRNVAEHRIRERTKLERKRQLEKPTLEKITEQVVEKVNKEEEIGVNDDVNLDPEAQVPVPISSSSSTTAHYATAEAELDAEIASLKLSLKDINPLKPMWLIFKRKNNIVILIASSLLFAFSFSITYTCSRTLGTYYHYNALEIGFVLVSFGAGASTVH